MRWSSWVMMVSIWTTNLCTFVVWLLRAHCSLGLPRTANPGSNRCWKVGYCWCACGPIPVLQCTYIRHEQECLEELAKTFPESPRVNVLTGIRMEASESPEVVLKFYDEQLTEDSSNAVGSCFGLPMNYNICLTYLILRQYGNAEFQFFAERANLRNA